MTERAPLRLEDADAELKKAIVASGLLDEAETLLERACAAIVGPDPLPRAIRYAVVGGGKRLRPTVTLAACRALGQPTRRAAAPAVAIEFIHAYSLVHDDLPAMDDDEERRGRPTVHVAFGEANAILVGDALQAAAFEVIAADEELTDAEKVRCMMILARASGAQGMVGGQVADMQMRSPSESTLLEMHAAKTGALFVASCGMGAVAGKADAVREQSLATFARAFGEAFQISDDLVDALELRREDAHEQQVNLAFQLGPHVAARRVEEATARALGALDALPGDRTVLEALARWVAFRARAAEGEFS
jgi:farnesyl diphosphate synthase